jgi:signal transduction histidine kinase
MPESATGRLLVELNHEVRTAVNAVLCLTELLLKSPLDAEQRSRVSSARAGADRLLMASSELLDVSRAELGRLQLREVRFNLHETLPQALKLLSILVAEDGVKLTARVAPSVPVVLVGDPERINQVVIALVRAGMDRIRKGEISVIAEHDPRTHQGFQINFSIVVRPAVEDPEHTLTLSKRLVEGMGGALRMEDPPRPAFFFSANLPAPPA